jgi:hypothetical protein
MILVAAIALRCREEARPVAPRVAKRPVAQVTEVASPAPNGAAEPFLFATSDAVLLSWLEPVAGSDRFAFRFARYRQGTWSAPRTIVERDDLVVNWADFPSVVEDEKGALFAHWLQKSGAATYASDVRISTSIDGGATWDVPFLLNRDGKKTEHGFATLVPLRDGGVGATWLDGRNMVEDAEEGDAGEMAVRYATLQANGTIAADSQLDARTCECCTTGMTITDRGPVVVYRDRSPDEIRDIVATAQTADGWTEPRLVRADGWKIAGCPVNGPQIDAIGDRVVTAWFTAPHERGRVFVAFSDDAGRTFGRAIRSDDGKPAGRVDVLLLDANTAVVTWLEQTPAGAEVRARLLTRDGKAQASVTFATTTAARGSGFPRAAHIGRDVYLAWTEEREGEKRIRMARRSF